MINGKLIEPKEKIEILLYLLLTNEDGVLGTTLQKEVKAVRFNYLVSKLRRRGLIIHISKNYYPIYRLLTIEMGWELYQNMIDERLNGRPKDQIILKYSKLKPHLTVDQLSLHLHISTKKVREVLNDQKY
jgi:hypothetical protein